jgi:anti-sigma factor (TIGR02949 family)
MSSINRLTCEETLRRLDDYLDRELTPQEMVRVREHLETCEVCAREYNFEGKVLTDLKAKLRRVKAPEDLVAKISKTIAQFREEGGG